MKNVAEHATLSPQETAAQSFLHALDPHKVVACKNSEALLHLLDPVAEAHNAAQHGADAMRNTARMDYPGKVVLTFTWKSDGSKQRSTVTIELSSAKVWANEAIQAAAALERQREQRAQNLHRVIMGGQVVTA